MRRSDKQERRKKRNTIVVGLVMIFLMVFSIIAFSLDTTNQQAGTFQYNNFTFQEIIIYEDQIFNQEIRKYSTQKDDLELEFFFTPSMMSQINISEENLSNLETTRDVSFTRYPVKENDFNVNLLYFDVIKIEYNKNSYKNILQGLTNHSLFDSDMDIITCEDASSNNLVFLLSEEIDQLSLREIQPYCFEIRGSGEDLLMISDFLIYKTHGVI